MYTFAENATKMCTIHHDLFSLSIHIYKFTEPKVAGHISLLEPARLHHLFIISVYKSFLEIRRLASS